MTREVDKNLKTKCQGHRREWSRGGKSKRIVKNCDKDQRRTLSRAHRECDRITRGKSKRIIKNYQEEFIKGHRECDRN